MRVTAYLLCTIGTCLSLFPTLLPAQNPTLAAQRAQADKAYQAIKEGITEDVYDPPVVPHLDPNKVYDAMKNVDYKGFTFVIAHRGLHSVPGMAENSANSIHRAYKAGSDGVELDIKTTVDNQVVFGHDWATGRELANWNGRPATPSWSLFSQFPIVNPFYQSLTNLPFLLRKKDPDPDNLLYVSDPNREKMNLADIWARPLNDTFNNPDPPTDSADTQMTLYEALYFICKYYPMMIWLDIKNKNDLDLVRPIIAEARNDANIPNRTVLDHIGLKLSWGTLKQINKSPSQYLKVSGLTYFLVFGTGELDDMKATSGSVEAAFNAFCKPDWDCLGGEVAHKYTSAPTQAIYNTLVGLHAQTGMQVAGFHTVAQYDWYWWQLPLKEQSETYGRWYPRTDGSCCFAPTDTLNISTNSGPEFQDLRPSYLWNEERFSTITTDDAPLILRDLWIQGRRNPALAAHLYAAGSPDVPSGGDPAQLGPLRDGIYKIFFDNGRLALGSSDGFLVEPISPDAPSTQWYLANLPNKKYTLVNVSNGKRIVVRNDGGLVFLVLSSITGADFSLSAGSGTYTYQIVDPSGNTFGPYQFITQAGRVLSNRLDTLQLPPPGYTYCANENGDCYIGLKTANPPGRFSIAFGANDSFVYLDGLSTADSPRPFPCNTAQFGGKDPAPGVAKACYIAPWADNSKFPSDVYDPTPFCNEGNTCSSSDAADFAFGANTPMGWSLTYKYISNHQSFTCSTSTFGQDPAPGLKKACYSERSPHVYDPSAQWATCALEGGTCSFATVPGSSAPRYASVSYGYVDLDDGKFKVTYKVMANGADCTNAAFGLDPATLYQKFCSYLITPPGYKGPPGFALCSLDLNKDTCWMDDVAAEVAFGNNGKYVYKPSQARSFACDKSSFDNDDPIPGTPKACWYRLY